MSTRAAGVAEQVFNGTFISAMNADARVTAAGYTYTASEVTTGVLLLVSQNSIKAAMGEFDAQKKGYAKRVELLGKLRAEIAPMGAPTEELTELDTQIAALTGVAQDTAAIFGSLITSDVITAMNAAQSNFVFTLPRVQLMALIVFEDEYIASRYADIEYVAVRWSSVLQNILSFAEAMPAGAQKTALLAAHSALLTTHSKPFIPGVGLVNPT